MDIFLDSIILSFGKKMISYQLVSLIPVWKGGSFWKEAVMWWNYSLFWCLHYICTCVGVAILYTCLLNGLQGCWLSRVYASQDKLSRVGDTSLGKYLLISHPTFSSKYQLQIWFMSHAMINICRQKISFPMQTKHAKIVQSNWSSESVCSQRCVFLTTYMNWKDKTGLLNHWFNKWFVEPLTLLWESGKFYCVTWSIFSDCRNSPMEGLESCSSGHYENPCIVMDCK